MTGIAIDELVTWTIIGLELAALAVGARKSSPVRGGGTVASMDTAAVN